LTVKIINRRFNPTRHFFFQLDKGASKHLMPPAIQHPFEKMPVFCRRLLLNEATTTTKKVTEAINLKGSMAYLSATVEPLRSMSCRS